MSNANSGDHYHVEKLDADAVCAQCSTVNAEGTLLCKVCGNNLRDQRNHRLMADQAMDLVHTGRRRRAWLSAVLFFLGLILVVSTLTNQEAIVAWLIDAETAREATAGDLWTGEYQTTFQPLLQEIEARGLTAESAEEALSNAASSSAMDGIYALFMDGEFLGSACVRTEEGYVYFAALLEDESEVRGIAREQANHFVSLPGSAGMNRSGRRGRVAEIKGVAMPQGNGVVECMGDNNAARASFLAYRLPDT